MNGRRTGHDGKDFYYIEFERGSHGYLKAKVWISSKLVHTEEACPYVEFPMKEAFFYESEKGTKIISSFATGKPSVIYLLENSSGFRGSADISMIKPDFEQVKVIYYGHRYHSGQGALGETAEMLVEAQSEIKVEFRRTGRRVDKEFEIFTFYPDGRVESEEELEVVELLGDE